MIDSMHSASGRTILLH